MKFCQACQRNVTPKRQIGIGTLLLALCTCGVWLLPLIFFYPKRCPICNGTSFG